MAYKFSKGKRGIGDIEFEDDADTGIDFEADSISLETSGSARLIVTNSTITTTVPLHISGSVTEGLRIAKGSSEYREIQFEKNGTDVAFIQVNSADELVIGCQSNNDEIVFQTTVGGSTTEAMRITATKRVGINEINPQTALHISGDDPRVRIDGITDSHPGLELSEAGTRKWIVYNNYTNDNLTFKTNNNIRMVIEQDGNVGIGTDNPTTALDIGGNSIRIRNAKTPSSASDTGDAGQVCWDNNYLYICIANNTWKRVSLNTW